MKTPLSQFYRVVAPLMLAAPLFVFAQIKLQNPIKYGNINDLLLAVVNVVIQYGAILVVLFLVFAGFQFVTAQGNTEKIEHAKKMLVWVVVGAFVLLGVYVIREAVCGTLNQIRAPGTPEFCAIDVRSAPPVGNSTGLLPGTTGSSRGALPPPVDPSTVH